MYDGFNWFNLGAMVTGAGIILIILFQIRKIKTYGKKRGAV